MLFLVIFYPFVCNVRQVLTKDNQLANKFPKIRVNHETYGLKLLSRLSLRPKDWIRVKSHVNYIHISHSTYSLIKF